MKGIYLTTADIVKWIKDWKINNMTYTYDEISIFAEELNNKIGQMDFRASNCRAVIGAVLKESNASREYERNYDGIFE